jgi:hypothetical protein
MEKKTKLTITLALAVLVITLSLGTVISIAPTESGARTAGPIENQQQMGGQIENQQQMAAPIQPEIEKAQPIKPPYIDCCLATASGRISASGPTKQYIWIRYYSTPADKLITTVTIDSGTANVWEGDPLTYRHTVGSGQSCTFITRGAAIAIEGLPACTGVYNITAKI